MAVQQDVQQDVPFSSAARPRSERLAGGGTSGNERLTAATGAALIGLLAVIGMTIIAIRPLLWVHLFVGILLIGPVALKMGATGYRFVRYYTGDPSYRHKGAPPAMMRLIVAPVVVVSTVVVFASGVALLLVGPHSRGTLLPIHKVSFFIWVAFTALHVLAHLPALPRALRADYAASGLGRDQISGRSGRVLSLAGALTAGAVLAILLIPQFAPWLAARGLHH
jgi:hypothetical protein